MKRHDYDLAKGASSSKQENMESIITSFIVNMCEKNKVNLIIKPVLCNVNLIQQI